MRRFFKNFATLGPLFQKNRSTFCSKYPSVTLRLNETLASYLVCRDGDELGRREGEGLDDLLRVTAHLQPALHLDDVDPRLVLVQAVQHDLAFAGRLVGQLDLCKADWVFGPVAAVVGRVGMNVDRIVWRRFVFATCKHILNENSDWEMIM